MTVIWHLPISNRVAIFGFFVVAFVACWTYPSLAENQSEADPAQEAPVEETLFESEDWITVGLLAEAIIYYAEIADESDRHSDDLWDLYLGTLECRLEMAPSSWLKGQITAALEDIGKKGDDAVASISSATLTIQYPDFPPYFIGGKRTQPFGVFEDRLISGTITEDLYEIDETGATFGLAVDRYAADVSLTVYEGQDIIANLEDFGTHEFGEGRRKERGIDAYIVNLTVSPIPETLDCSISYNHEPGDGRDNQTVGGALSLHFLGCVMDAEYITAIQRELGEDGEENLENAWLIGLAYQATEALELATRFEVFDDDREAEQDGVVKNRYLAGFTYELNDHVSLAAEYRHSRYEREHGSIAADRNNEIQLQFAIEY